MKYQSENKKIYRPLWMIVCLLMFVACQKEVVPNEVDAFAQLENRVTVEMDQYKLTFQLAPFPYKTVTVKLSTDVHDFTTPESDHSYIAYPRQKNQYAVFFDHLTPLQTYYYQILVSDGEGSVALSDVYNFTTD